jgi:hypothetical protein
MKASTAAATNSCNAWPAGLPILSTQICQIIPTTTAWWRSQHWCQTIQCHKLHMKKSAHVKAKTCERFVRFFFYFIMLTILHMVCKPWMVLVMKLRSEAVSCSSKQAAMNARSCNFAADISWKLDSITFIWADEGDGRQGYHTMNKILRKSYEDKIDCFL